MLKVKKNTQHQVGKKILMIKLLILDVDGVLTDGNKTYDINHTCVYKKFNDRDFTAIKRFKATGINVVLLSGDIFNKSPKIKDTIVIYRGVNDDYYIKKSTKGIYNSDTLSSYTLDHKTAINYASKNCCIMRVKLIKGCKAILLDNISPYDEAEILLPFDTKYNIDHPRHFINYYKQNDICPDDTKSKKIMVTDLSVITSINSR